MLRHFLTLLVFLSSPGFANNLDIITDINDQGHTQLNVALLATVAGHRDILENAFHYATQGSSTPTLLINNGQATAPVRQQRTHTELGDYTTTQQIAAVNQAIDQQQTGQMLDLSAVMQHNTLITANNNANFISNYNHYLQNPTADKSTFGDIANHISAPIVGYLEQAGRNWEITFTDKQAPAYIRTNAQVGVFFDAIELATLGTTATVNTVRRVGSMLSKPTVALGARQSSKVMPSFVKHNVGEASGGGANSGAEQLVNLKGFSRNEAGIELRKAGFEHKGTTPGGYDKYYHPDGSRVQIRPNGEVVRTGPKVQNSNPNLPGYRPRIGPDGKPTNSHNTGEILD